LGASLPRPPWGRVGAIAIVVASFGCGSNPPTPAPPTTVPPVAAPSPTPSPSPAAEPEEPRPTPEPDLDPSACPSPKPPPLARIDVAVLIVGVNRLILDSTPMVGPDPDFCEAIGYTDRRRYCPPRPEGHPDRAACDSLLVGRALDTNRYGPRWFVNNHGCVNYAVRPPFCVNHPENQFLVQAFGAGFYEACSQSGVCGGVRVR
jgi:hypothetical protein